MEKETEKMRVLLVSEYFYPRSKGGTEKYVHELARGLRSHTHEVFILTVSDDSAVYDFDGFAVHSIAFCSDKQSRVIANIDPPDNLDAFREVLSNISPDVVHFHTLTTSAGIFHIQAAATMGAKLFFTSHIPGNTCIRGNLMRYGTSGCDGSVRLRGCLSCYMNGRGVPRGLAEPLSLITRTLKFPDPLWRAADIKKELLEQLRETCRFVIVLSEWQRRVYLLNGFTDENLTVSRHIFKKAAPLRPGTEKTAVTVGFAGRISPEKGLHVLLSAFRRLDASVFKLSIAGIRVQEHNAYLEKLLRQTSVLKNISWNFDFGPDQMNTFYAGIDVMCIPSLWYETGPYVMFEAVGRGLPVIGSDLGGIKEWMELGYPVSVYPHNKATALYKLLSGFSRNGIKEWHMPAERNEHDLAAEMIALYAGNEK